MRHKGEWRLKYLGWAGLGRLGWSRGPRGGRFLALHSQCGGIGRQCGRILILVGVLVTGRPVTGKHARGGPGPAPARKWKPRRGRRGSRRGRRAKLRGRTLGGGSCYCCKICQHSRPMHGSPNAWICNVHLHAAVEHVQGRARDRGAGALPQPLLGSVEVERIAAANNKKCYYK